MSSAVRFALFFPCSLLSRWVSLPQMARTTASGHGDGHGRVVAGHRMPAHIARGAGRLVAHRWWRMRPRHSGFVSRGSAAACVLAREFCSSLHPSAADALAELHLTPDILSYGLDGSTGVCNVEWSNGKSCRAGNELKPADVQEPPTVSYDGAEEHASYVIVMTDPDAPSRSDPRFREWWHCTYCHALHTRALLVSLTSTRCRDPN